VATETHGVCFAPESCRYCRRAARPLRANSDILQCGKITCLSTVGFESRNGLVFIVIGAIKKVADHMVAIGICNLLTYMIAAGLWRRFWPSDGVQSVPRMNLRFVVATAVGLAIS
jgi:hypothetical protein